MFQVIELPGCFEIEMEVLQSIPFPLSQRQGRGVGSGAAEGGDRGPAPRLLRQDGVPVVEL